MKIDWFLSDILMLKSAVISVKNTVKFEVNFLIFLINQRPTPKTRWRPNRHFEITNIMTNYKYSNKLQVYTCL